MPLEFADPKGKATQFWAGTDASGNPDGNMRVYCSGTNTELFRPCVDCGLYTGRFCDYCLASERIPSEKWAKGQRTPFCGKCEDLREACHYCLGVHLARPFAQGDGNLAFDRPAVPDNQPDAEPKPEGRSSKQ